VDVVRPWIRDGETAGLLSRSAWSLALIALWRLRGQRESSVSVWLPDFFCNSALHPLRATGITLVFYPVAENLGPDMAACRRLVSGGAPSLFVLVHYFGQPIAAAPARDFCASHGAWLIEDAAHVLRPIDGVGSNGDFVLYSPHKLLAAPDGAVLVVRPEGPGKLGEHGIAALGEPGSWPAQLRSLASELQTSPMRSQQRTVTWLAKRVLQKLGVRRSRPESIPFGEIAASAQRLPPDVDVPAASSLARRLITAHSEDLGSVARRRQRHQLLWDAVVAESSHGATCLLAGPRPRGRDWIPYLSVHSGHEPAVETLYGKWNHLGWPVTTWPDLPPEVIANPDGHQVAWHLRHSRVYLPVHQSLSELRVARLRRRSTTEDDARVSVSWNRATRAEWHAWLTSAGKSNLLQSWGYGDAKIAAGAWRVRRAVFHLDDEPLAIAQVLERRFGPVRVLRINRGPLPLRSLQPAEERLMWRQIAKLAGAWRGRVLAIAPEIPLAGTTLALMADLGFRAASPRGWESVWIDLGLDLDLMRKRLHGKWRNMLTSAEKAGLTLEVGKSDELFDWILRRYGQVMSARYFRGPPPKLLRDLRRRVSGDDELVVFRAMHDGDAVAGICVASHGSAATYLLGWNGDRGRALKANQYLLWQAIVNLKTSGFRWFDLGGVDEETTPGIAAFKLGLGGERYELVGEYLRW
jgi:hypothetical protein